MPKHLSAFLAPAILLAGLLTVPAAGAAGTHVPATTPGPATEPAGDRQLHLHSRAKGHGSHHPVDGVLGYTLLSPPFHTESARNNTGYVVHLYTGWDKKQKHCTGSHEHVPADGRLHPVRPKTVACVLMELP
ncbi:hypothetical protein [Streptomyces marincola]|uniref:hypothetical protein n=1 Tax=Streptomyces marincola TaxID=2878388 RepID=UPI001CF447EE|nr:hypothetical protein [Streptomyces marincola]UCM90588.1 hypothetical protein LC193_23085 [Streptomyces marincola]